MSLVPKVGGQGVTAVTMAVSPPHIPLFQVGFLKILHKYEITFVLPLVPSLGRDICPLPVPSPNLRVISVTSLPEGTVSPPCHHPGSRPCPKAGGEATRSCPLGEVTVPCSQGCPQIPVFILLLLGFFFPGSFCG